MICALRKCSSTWVASMYVTFNHIEYLWMFYSTPLAQRIKQLRISAFISTRKCHPHTCTQRIRNTSSAKLFNLLECFHTLDRFFLTLESHWSRNPSQICSLWLFSCFCFFLDWAWSYVLNECVVLQFFYRSGGFCNEKSVGVSGCR